MGKYSYKNALIILKEWALNEGFINISFDYDDISQIDWIKSTLNTPNSIKIEANLSYELQTYIFLHELGHHELRKDWDKFHKILPTSAKAEEHLHSTKDRKLIRRISYIVSHMEEEYKAWEEGLKLGENLGIKINPEKWLEIKTKCLIQYIRYFANK